MDKNIYDSTSLIIESIENQSRAEQKNIEELSEKLYKEKAAALEKEISDKYDALVEYELEKQRIDANKKASALESENKAALAEMRKKVTDEVFAGAFDGIKRFVQTDAYAEFLEKSASSMGGLYDGKAEILIRKADDGFKPLILKAFGKPADFVYDDSIVLGGIKVHFADKAVIADDCLDSRLEAQKKNFINTSGLGFKR